MRGTSISLRIFSHLGTHLVLWLLVAEKSPNVLRKRSERVGGEELAMVVEVGIQVQVEEKQDLKITIIGSSRVLGPILLPTHVGAC